MEKLRPFTPLVREREHSTSAWSDLIGVFRQRVEHRWVFALLSIAIPTGLFVAFMIQYDREADYKPPEVIYFKDWRGGRTDAEAAAQQAIDAPRERAEKKALAEAEAKKRAQYRAVAEKMGVDVDR
jgi:hypothetical protein